MRSQAVRRLVPSGDIRGLMPSRAVRRLVPSGDIRGLMLSRAVRRLVFSRPVRRLVLVFAIAGAIVLLDQALRPLVASRLTGARIPVLGGRIVLERLDDPATAATLGELRSHLTMALGAVLVMAALSKFMGWYGVALLTAFGLVLGGAESNHLSMLAYGFVLNWIGYRIDGPVFVVAPADLMQMAGLAIIASAMTLFTAATVGELLPDPPPAQAAAAAVLAGPLVTAEPGVSRGTGWNARSMIAAR